MQAISAAYTPEQILDRTKTVTRRLGWKNLKTGTRLEVFRKTRGVRKEERELLATIEVVSARREPLFEMTWPHRGVAECRKEGFPDMSPEDFVDMFCRNFHCKPSDEVTRIEFRYVDEDALDLK